MIYFGIDGSQPRARLEGLREAPVLYSVYRGLPMAYFDTFSKIALDTGAYPSWKAGETKVDFDEYFDIALASHNSYPFEFVASDMSVDWDFTTTMHHCQLMRNYDLPAIPAFKQGEDLGYLDYLVDQQDEIDYIGIGATDKDTQSFSTGQWLEQVFERICDSRGRPKIKVHGFRLVGYYERYPFYSCDSTSWAQRKLPDLKKAAPWGKDEELMPLVVSYYTRMQSAPRYTGAAQTVLELKSA
tara:strand:+ start:82 stop:807 length:726 start_codon:yes stop_codon:yes gene_type:complete